MTENLANALLDAEARFQAAQLAGDISELDTLIDDRLIATGPDGVLVTKAVDLQAHRDRLLTISTLQQEQLDHVVVGGTGVTALLARLTGSNQGTPFDVRLRYTRTWIHDGGWRILAAHISVVGQAE